MDPLGLALENFNPLALFREQERNQDIDASGELITGEQFEGIEELKRILVTEHEQDFYRCATEKLLTYALGRGLDYYDVEAVDRILQRLEESDGSAKEWLLGVVESEPFLRSRPPEAETETEGAATAGGQ